MELPANFNPNTGKFSFLHGKVGHVAYTPEGDVSKGRPESFVFMRVLTADGQYYLAKLEEGAVKVLSDSICGKQAKGEVSGNRIRCKKCAPWCCIFRRAMYSHLAGILDEEKRLMGVTEKRVELEGQGLTMVTSN